MSTCPQPAATPCSHLSERAHVVVDSTTGGVQVVARATIQCGDVVAVFGGRIVSLADWRRPTAHELLGVGHGLRASLQLEDDLFLMPRVPGPAEQIPHSCQPNCGFAGDTTLVAMRRIEAGDPLSFDFGACDAWPGLVSTCHCGASQCRGRVTGEDWMSPALQEKLDGYFSGYLQRRVDECVEKEVLSDMLKTFGDGPRLLH